MTGQTHSCTPRFRFLDALPRPGVGPFANLIVKMPAVLGVISMITGISASLSCAAAKINEPIGKTDAAASDYTHNILPRELVVHFLVDDDNAFLWNDYYDLESWHNSPLEKLHRIENLDYTKDIVDFGELIVPEAVWSLDVSTGAHLEQKSDQFGSGLEIGYRRRAQEFFDPWTSYTRGNRDVLLFSPPQFQVATCSRSAERPNLDHCNPNNNLLEPFAGDSNEQRHRDPGSPIIAWNNGSNLLATSAANQESQSGTVRDLSPLTRSGVIDSALADLSTVSNLCEGVLYCSIVANPSDYWLNFLSKTYSSTESIEFSITPAERSVTQIDLSTDLPTALISGGDPLLGSDLGTIYSPTIVSPTVPEASTWIMVLIGFSIIAAASKGLATTKRAAGVNFLKII